MFISEEIIEDATHAALTAIEFCASPFRAAILRIDVPR